MPMIIGFVYVEMFGAVRPKHKVVSVELEHMKSVVILNFYIVAETK